MGIYYLLVGRPVIEVPLKKLLIVIRQINECESIDK